jgi:hypothetical protein
VIRRGFWLALGAALGVTGYRRASRLANAVLPGGSRTARWRAGSRTAGFLRDVRDGMDEYLERRAGLRGPTLDGQQLTGALPAGAGRRQDHPGIDYVKDGR